MSLYSPTSERPAPRARRHCRGPKRPISAHQTRGSVSFPIFRLVRRKAAGACGRLDSRWAANEQAHRPKIPAWPPNSHASARRNGCSKRPPKAPKDPERRVIIICCRNLPGKEPYPRRVHDASFPGPKFPIIKQDFSTLNVRSSPYPRSCQRGARLPQL